MGRKQHPTKAKPQLRIPIPNPSSDRQAQLDAGGSADGGTAAAAASPSEWARAEFRGAGGTGSVGAAASSALPTPAGFGGALGIADVDDGEGRPPGPRAAAAAAMRMRQPSIRSAQYMEDASFEIVPQPPPKTKSPVVPPAAVRSDKLRDPKEVADEKAKDSGDDPEEELVACESGEMTSSGAAAAAAGGDIFAVGGVLAPEHEAETQPNSSPPKRTLRHSSTLSMSQASYHFDDEPEPEERPPSPPQHETEAFESTIVNGRKMISVTDGNTSEVISRRNLSVRLPDSGGNGGGRGGDQLLEESLTSLDLDEAGVSANIGSVASAAKDLSANNNKKAGAVSTRSAQLESLQHSQISIDASLGEYSQRSVDTDRDADDIDRAIDGMILSAMETVEEEDVRREDENDSGAVPVEERWRQWKREVGSEGELELAGEGSRSFKPRGSFASIGSGVSNDRSDPGLVRRSSDSHILTGRATLGETSSVDDITELLRHISSGRLKDADDSAGGEWRPPSDQRDFNDSWGALASGQQSSNTKRRRTVEQICIDTKGIIQSADADSESDAVSERNIFDESAQPTAMDKREDGGESGSGLSKVYPKTHSMLEARPQDRRRSSVSFDEASTTNLAYRQQASHPDREVAALYALFQPLSQPNISVDAVANVVRDERGRWTANSASFPGDSHSSLGDVQLPRAPIIGTSQVGQASEGGAARGPSAVLSASPPSDNFLALPLYVQSALLRILLRLLTGEDDSEYNEACLFPYLEGDSDILDDSHCDPDAEASETLNAARAGVVNHNHGRSTDECKAREDTWDGEGSGSLMWKDTARGRASDDTEVTEGEVMKGSSMSSSPGPGAGGTGTDRRKGFREMKKDCSVDDVASEENLLKSFTSIRRGLGQKVDELSIVDRFHRVVAFCSFGHWGGSKDKYASVEAILRLYEDAAGFNPAKEFIDDGGDGDDDAIGSAEENRRILYERRIIGPLARLLGLFSATSIAPRQLKRILDLISGKAERGPSDQPLSLPSRLVLLRALKDSAGGGLTGMSDPLGDKSAGPTSFFVFSRGSGISRAVQPTLDNMTVVPPNGGPVWPFKSDGWATSIWFRAETFLGPGSGDLGTSERSSLRRGGRSTTEDHKDTSILLDMRSADGAGISVRLVPFATGAATLTVTSTDAAPTPASLTYLSTRTLTAALSSSQPQSVRLKGCVLLPRVWYHVCIRHTKPKFRGMSLSNVRDEVTVILDGKNMLTEHLRFPRVSNVGCPYTITLGSNFVGQIGSLHIFKDFVSEATLKALFEETADKTRDTVALQAGNAAFLVWDPVRTIERSEKKVLLEVYSGLHASCGGGVATWTVSGAKDSIGSCGGVQSLLPVFEELLCCDLSLNENAFGVCGATNAALVPTLLAVLSAFVRDHAENAREMIRCGGIGVVELYLQQNKQYGRSAMRMLRSSKASALFLVDVLKDLRIASAHSPDLYHLVFEGILFNLRLWFGDVVRLPGVVLYETLLPELSSIAREEPASVFRCLSMISVVEFIREHIYLGTDTTEIERLGVDNSDALFVRNGATGLPDSIPLTILERRHATDVIFGIVVAMLSSAVTEGQLAPLLHFVSYSLDAEWDQTTAEGEQGQQTNLTASNANRNERNLATTKACVVLLYLLQRTPAIPSLIEILTSYFSSKDAVGSWVLCCLVNTFDDLTRSVGIRVLVSYLQAVSPAATAALSAHDAGIGMPTTENSGENSGSVALQIASGQVKGTITEKMKSMGSAVGIGATSQSQNTPANVKVMFKLLWHLLKCHRERLGEASHAAMVHLLVESPMTDGSTQDEAVVPDIVGPRSYRFHVGWLTHNQPLTPHLGNDALIRSDYAISTFFRLLRFLPNDMKAKWLFDILALVRVAPLTMSAFLGNNDWQPQMFHLLSEAIEEISSHRTKSNTAALIFGVNLTNDVDEPSDDSALVSPNHGAGSQAPGKRSSETNPSKQAPLPSDIVRRFDLIVKLYSLLLGHSIRKGGDKAFKAIETAASLQRTCVNGHETFSCLLSHVLAELIEQGTVAEINTSGDLQETNRALKNSAKLVTNAILSNGTFGLDIASAIKTWRCLRHLSAIVVGVVTASGFGVADLFDYRNQHASAFDESGGLHGIRIHSGFLPGMSAEESAVEASIFFNAQPKTSSLSCSYRRNCVNLSSQLLCLLDAFIFPDTLDPTDQESQLFGLTLVRSTEPRLGQAQGPLLASLVRLSLVLLSHLEPSSVLFLQCCSRLKCLFSWTLELIRESVASVGGYSKAFGDNTAKLDRLVLAVVLQCHRALSRCSAVLVEIESTPYQKYFASNDSKHRNLKRLLRSTQELKEIVSHAFRSRNDVCRSGLSLEAYESLQMALEEPQQKARRGRKSSSTAGNTRSRSRHESQLTEDAIGFLSSPWVTGFMDIESYESNDEERTTFSVPEMASNRQNYRNRTALTAGFDAVGALAKESNEIVAELNRCLDIPFEDYLEEQRRWADTNLVRDMEYDGDVTVKTLAGRHKNDLDISVQQSKLRDGSTKRKVVAISTKVVEPWKSRHHWKFSSSTDRLHRRIVLVYNRNHEDHTEASYELMLVRDREKAQREREERLRKRAEKEKEAAAEEASRRASASSMNQINALELLEDVAIVDNYNSESSASDMAAAMRAAREGIVPMAQAAAKLEADEEDEMDYIEDFDDEVEEEDDEQRNILEPAVEGSGDAENLSVEEPRRDWAHTNIAKEQEEEQQQEEDWAKELIFLKEERIVKRFESVSIVTLRTITDGDLLLTSHGLYFRQTGEEVDVMTKESAGNNHSDDEKRDVLGSNQQWRLSRLHEVHGRRFMLRSTAIELFFVDLSAPLFINFHSGVTLRDNFYSKIRSSRCVAPLLRSPQSLAPRTVFHRSSHLTEMWRQRRLSNFEYIMQLNRMAGRTYSDIGQYPIFPWILADYESETLDLNDSRTFRDLTKPVGALNPDRLAQLIDRYNSLDGFPEEQKFLYGSHYSSPGFVLHYLMRQEPFTSMHIALQSGRFDCPDRLFFDIAGTWKGCLTSSSDVKELIPEFFTCPEMFCNTNDFDLGTTQSKVKVHDVKLPPWAKGSAHEFVHLHRLALESDYVSNNLHHWIDLIFGYKQRGEEAAKAHNVFHYLSYEGSVDIDKITDDIDRQATETHIQNFGQTPSQLMMKQPHPPRYPRADAPCRPICQDLSKLKELRCFTPKSQFGGHQGSEANGAVLSIHPLSTCCVVVYGDLSIGTYRWATSSGSNRSASSFAFKMLRHQPLGTRNMTLNPEVFNAEHPRSASLATRKEESFDRNGRLAMGNWSFAIVMGGAAKSSYSRRQASGRPKVTDVPLSTPLILSTGYIDGCIRAHALDSLRQKDCSDGGHRGGINCLSVDDEEFLCTGGIDGTVRVWVIDHQFMSQALADGYAKTASAGILSSTMSTKVLSLCHCLIGHSAAITCVSISSDLDVVSSGSLDGVICIHSLRTGKFHRKIEANRFYMEKRYRDAERSQKITAIRKIAVSRHGTMVVHLNDGMLHSYSVNGAILYGVDAGEVLNSMKICADGEALVTGGESCHVVIRKMSDLTVRCVLDLSTHGPVTDIALTSSDSANQYILVGTADGKVTVIGENHIEQEDEHHGGNEMAYLVG